MTRKRLPLFLKIILGALGAVILLLLALFIYMRLSPIRIGVILNLSGPESLPYRQVIEWAKENCNRKIEIVYVDSNGEGSIEEKARPLLEDRSIRAVIGPQNSDEAFILAPLFIEKKKLLISPTTTSADLYRAFAKQDYFWRTTESDVAQAQIIIDLLAEKGAKKVALVYADTSYGKTFYDWIGFYATEKNMSVTSIQALKPDSDLDLLANNATVGDPDYIILATLPKDTAELKNRWDQKSAKAKLFLTDLSSFDSLIETLGDRAEGLEITGPSTTPDSGFVDAYKEKFGEEPPAFMAPTYDAFLMAVAAMARQEYAHRYSIFPSSVKENTAASLRKFLFEEKGGKTYKWNELGLALDDISHGEIPSVIGASVVAGYDMENGVDPIGTYYAYSIVKDGKFSIQRLIPSSNASTSAVGTVGSDHLANITGSEVIVNLPEKKELKAVIVATSSEWQNYRHQSDAFAMYQQLKSNGLTDDSIHLFAVDDIADYDKNNPRPSLFHIKNGTNNYAEPAIDISGQNVTALKFKEVLTNLTSNENTNILVYIAGHGGTGTDSSSQLGDEGVIRFSNGDPLTSHELRAVIEEMAANKKYRQMLFVLETCFSGAMAKDITAKNVLFLTAASDQEVSYGANYNSHIRQWLADQFTYQFIEYYKKEPDSLMSDFYNKVYSAVPGSHVTLQNWNNFDNLRSTKISDFMTP